MDQVDFRSTVGYVLIENVNPEVDMKMGIVALHVQLVAGPAVLLLEVATQGILEQVRNFFDRNVSEPEIHVQD